MRKRETITIPKTREQIIEEALTRERSVRLHREAEAHLVGNLPPIIQPSPKPFVPQRIDYLQIFFDLINLKKFLP